MLGLLELLELLGLLESGKDPSFLRLNLKCKNGGLSHFCTANTDEAELPKID